MQDEKLRKGPWLEEEDEKLSAAVAVLGEKRWDSLAKSSGLRRSGKSCRLRWLNYLRPNLKHGGITTEEERVIIELHEKWGNKWARIAQKLPGRTDNEIKNYWRSYLKRKAIVLDKDSGSTSLRSEECEADSPNSINNECLSFKDDVLGSTSCSSDAFELLSLTSSPYETRMSEWMANWSPDICKMESENELWNFGSYDAERISHDIDNSIWDFSLWEG